MRTHDPFRRGPLSIAFTVLRRLVAVAAVLAMTFGVPTGLVRFFGNPLPDTWPSDAAGWQHLLTAGFTDETIIGLVVVCLWAVWALWCYSLLIESLVLLSGRADRDRSTSSPMRGMAAALIAGILATPAAGLATPAPGPATAAVAVAAPRPQAPTSSVVWAMPGAVVHPVAAAPVAEPEKPARLDLPRFAVAAHTGPLTVQVAGRQSTLEVQAGDTLWGIAERCLGDGQRYREIFELNRDRYDSAGRMLGGDHIEPGWVLTLPDDATTPADSQQQAPPNRPESPPPSPVTQTPQTPQPSTPPTAAPSHPQGTDGVAPLPSTAPTAPTTPAPQTTHRPTDAPENPTASKPGVGLTGNSWVDLGLAGAILAAAAAVWAHRRRRYTPLPPTPTARDNDPDLRPLPKTVGRIRRAMRAGPSPLPVTSTTTSPDDADQPPREPMPLTGASAAGPVTPALDSEHTATWSPAGLGLTGPGAHAAARGLLAATLANGDVSDPHRHSRVLIPATTLATLIGPRANEVAGTPRLTVVSDLDAALEALDTTALLRARTVYDHEAEDVAGVRANDPLEEPMPPVVLFADSSTRHAAARLAALLTQGRRLDLHGILLGDWPHGSTVDVAEDGTTTRPDGAPANSEHPADLGRLAVLDPEEACDLLRLLAEATTGQPQPEPETSDHQAHNEKKADLYVRQAHQEDDPAELDVEVDGPSEEQAGRRTGRPVRVTLLGGFDIIGGVDPVPEGDSLRGKAKELLIYLAANGGRASKDALIENLLPDAKVASAHHRLNTISSNLRTYLRRVNGPGLYLERTAHHYQLRRDELDIDLMRLFEALAVYDAASEDSDRCRALREALSAYGGPLANGMDIDWIDIDRSTVTRRVLDAHIALAELLATTAPTESAALLDRAILLDPTAEGTYRHAMRHRAALGDATAVRALRRAITASLADIDADPAEETLQLAEQLLTGLQT
ncbi:LysM peptidoglycan-binding domain-containing protein [Longispora sp. NPDC051575]|uniref:LysM peptidoglycan-binding domain-containing protein n=1 Tax=Longispora sp. NPDC051575 TaxID=3154943 RepID=UPI003431E20D